MPISHLFNRVPSAKSLIKAVKGDDPVTVSRLLARGADANAADPDGSSVLILAAYGNNPLLVQMLVLAGADVHHKNRYGTTARMYAAMGGYRGVVEILDRAGAAPVLPPQEEEKPARPVPPPKWRI
ncbi:MAG: ankyrin repeat domain-containing protein [Alphaproteobacteria bacterium]|nr:ankyrin repeat domain-containing protein [Alphaproteobacteria bacterium]